MGKVNEINKVDKIKENHVKSIKSTKSSQIYKTKSTKSCAHKANFFKHLCLYFSSIVIATAKTKLVIFFNCVLKEHNKRSEKVYALNYRDS